MTTPYTYLIKWDDGYTYIGSRVANGCHPDEFFSTGGYFTSSKYVKEKIQKSGLPTTCIILAQWGTRKEAYDHETLLLECFDARNNPLFLNKHNNNFPLINWDNLELRNIRNSPEVKAKQSRIQKEVNSLPEVKKNKSIAAIKAHSNPEVKAKRAASDNDPVVKARRSAAAKARWAKEENRKKQAATQMEVASRPGERERRSARAIATEFWLKKK